MMQKILLVEDERTISKRITIALTAALEERGTVMPAYTVAEAKKRLEEHCIDLAIFDIKLPDGNGLDLVREIRKIQKDMPIMIVSSYVTAEEQVALNNEIDLFLCLQKPFDVKDIVPKIMSKLDQIENRKIRAIWLKAKGSRKKTRLNLDTIIKVSTVKSTRQIEILFISLQTGEVTKREFPMSCLKHFIGELPEKHGLVQINQSVMVNPHYALDYNGGENELRLLHTDQIFSISKKHFPEAQQLFSRQI